MNLSHRNHQRGLSAIEFVIAMPIVFILLAAVIELGIALVKYQTLTKLVQFGARYGVSQVYNTTGAQVADTAQIKCAVVTGSTSDMSADCGNSTNKPLPSLNLADVSVSQTGDYLYVTAIYRYSPLLNFGVVTSDYTLDLSASALMRAK
ncbi:pilus assembly protein [Vibrio sp.]|uniref:Pilus assembly protein n=1 Tax=Vibrio viridaestus TaxID=2487322 RepID=A0A3N9THP4_9VIBR|nr:TadE/TadG family type IV pilus assembly protein [Vibrio viridaestus]MDC0609344.1 pilus assembly protein [Vibrio sp.]RQW63025.1 pilus assembly protein [Vibrio viridaestus]